MIKGFALTSRVALLAVVVLLCFAGIGTKLVFLHVIDRDKLVSYVDKNRRKVTIQKARRGDIVDARNYVLATSRSVITVAVDPSEMLDKDAAKWPQLANLVGMPYPELYKICTTKKRPGASADAVADTASAASAPATSAPAASGAAKARKPGKTKDDIQWVKISDGVSESTYDAIQKLDIRGVVGDREYRRIYPHNQLAAHLIGFVNKEEVPSAGIEVYSNPWLFAADGWRETEKDARQRELAQFRSREAPVINGYTVKLSIDSVIQNWAEEELAGVAQKYSPKRAVIIVSEAQTGFILALANYPTFNLNEYNKAPMDVLKNYAITDQIDPGSTFKIVAASAALNENIVTPDTRFDCSSETAEYRGRTLRLVPDDHRWDHQLSVAEIISHSSNRGAALLAMRLGEQRFYEYARAFGFGSPTGFPFGGEIDGALNPPKKWSGIDITRIPAGYSISATPMQIHCAMATIASGGEYLTPQIIRQINDPDGNPVFTFQKKVQRRVLTPKTAATMAFLLQGVVSRDGTAGKIALPGYQLAGKTGTAQKLIDGHYSRTNHVGSFVGFFPASAPRVVVTVIIDDATVPEGRAAYGSLVAAPSFKNIAEKLIPYLDIKPVPPPAPGGTRTLYAARNQ